MMHKMIEEALEVYEREVDKFWQKYFPLSKKENIEYKDWKDLSIDMGKLITIQRVLSLSREEIAKIMIKSMLEASKTSLSKI